MIKSNIHVVWLSDPKDMYETEWIHTLLQEMIREYPEITYDEIYHPARTDVIKNAMIIFNHADHDVSYDDYLQKYEDAKVPFVAVQLSDEILGVSYKFYNYSMCVHVFRNYMHPSFIYNPKVTVFGLGFKSGFGSSRHPSNEDENSKNLWCFVGTAHTPERVRVFEPLKAFTPYTLITGNKFGEGVQLSEYKRIMESSWFALCPIGQCNLDTFRFYEALEANTIPVVLGSTWVQRCRPSYWHFIFPWEQDMPFIILDTWDQAPTVLESWFSKPKSELEEQRRKLKNFWIRAKKYWASMIGKRCKELISLTA